MRVARLRALTQSGNGDPEINRLVEMRVARLRALTLSFYPRRSGIFPVEMRVARLRALTPFLINLAAYDSGGNESCPS